MPVRHASAAGPDDLLPAHDLQTLHQTQGEGALDHAPEEEAAVDVAAGSQVRGPGPQGAPLRVPALLADAPDQGHAPLANQPRRRRLHQGDRHDTVE